MEDLVKTESIPAPVDSVWAAWTTVGGARGFFAPDAHIEAAPGGAYELYFALDLPEGQRGSEGCKVLALDHGRRLEFSWNFPPSLPGIRGCHTRVIVLLREDDGETAVTLRHTGFEEGEEWEQGRAYFDRAWSVVLGRLRDRFDRGPVDWDAI